MGRAAPAPPPPPVSKATVAGNGAGRRTPDLAGRWTRIAQEAPPEAQRVPATAGSGWGDEITIAQDAAALTIERAQFVTYDMQPPMRFAYALDGSESRNVINIGRGPQEQVSRASWQGDTLVISTRHASGSPLSSDVTYVFSLDGPTLVIEMRRPGGVHPSSTTHGRYRKVS